MPVSGNKEPGVIARQSSSCSAGVPIKKRRFPLIRPPSPPAQEPSSVRAENDSLQKEHSNPSQESTPSNASVATNSPGGFSDASKNSFSEEKNEGLADTNVNSVQDNVNVSRVKLEEPSLTICSGSMDSMDSEEKVVLTEKFSCQKITGNTELQLAPNEAIALDVEKEILSKQKVEGDCKLELSTVPGNTELSLGLKEPLVPAFIGQNSEGSCHVPDKLDPSTLSLSLGKEKPINQCGSDDVRSNHDGANLHANRSNWDLNTTMDAWEGSVGEAAAGQGTVGFDGLNETGGTLDVKPSICSTGTVGVGVDSGKQILVEGENRSNFPISSLNRSEDSLRLRLSTSSLQANFRGEHSGSSAKVDSGWVVPNPNLLVVPNSNLVRMMVSSVKAEPLDGNAKHDFVVAKGSPMGLLDIGTVKREYPQRYGLQAVKLSTSSPQKLVDHRTIKSEPAQEGNQETHKTTEGTSTQSDGKVVWCHDNRSSTMAVPLTLTSQKLCSALPTCSTELSISGDVSNQSEHSIYNKEVNINMDAPQDACVSVNQVASETVSLSEVHEGKELNVCDGRIDTSREEGLNVNDPEKCRLKLMDEIPLDSRGNGEGSASDEEKINISADMLEEDSYGSDYESDGNHAPVVPMDTEDRKYDGEDDEYEDGEVREPLMNAAVEDPIGEKREAENVNLGECDNKNVESFGLPGDGSFAQSRVEEKDSKMEDHGEASDYHIKECVDTGCDKKADKGVDKDGSLQEPLTVEVVAAEAVEKSPIKANTRRKPLDPSGKKEVQEGHETEVSFDKGTNESQGTVAAVGQAADGNIKGTDGGEKSDSTLPETESLNGDASAKDANGGGNRSRIINLPRACNETSPCKTRFISGRSLPSQAGRERCTDFEGDKLHPRGNRDEIYVDGPRNFFRERIQDQSQRNSRLNFMRGRGRVSSRLDTQRGDWETNRDFAPENYNGVADYRFPRHKHPSAVADAELEGDGYIIAPGGAIVGTGRGGRKPFGEELCSFRHPSARRQSPRGRDGPATLGIQMVHRIPRNISPSRCIGEDGSDLVGLRPGEKFMRGLPDDVVDPIFTRPQPPFEGEEGQFVRGNRNFSSVQRRALPRIRSKSPIRYRARSPGPWTSPRRRSPDGFNGLPELTHRRSPAIYRIERMRSPDHPCFPEEMVARRHGSPPYMSRPSNDLRDIDTGRDRGHPRAVIPNRSPSDRVLPRGTRRFDILDPRERTDHDEYFGGPMHPGRFHGLGGDGSGDERRKCGERRGPVRSFRPPYNGANDENFRFHVEDGPRPFRFCREADSEFLERSNFREREFERQIKNRHVNAPRRTRSIEEQEGNYRHGGQVWHDDGFDDVSRVKRRRF